MATAAFPEKVGDDSTQCTICFYTFKNPKVLPCLHTFCEHCLREWVEKNDGDTFPCPICRQLVPLPQNGVDGLKDNFFIASLVKALTEHHKVHHGKDDLACTNCEEGKPATSRCSECAEFLCESCESAHRLLRATKSHTLFTFEELKTGKYDNVFRARKAPPCSKHSGEILKLYCRTCETPICNECALFEHRDSQHDYTRIEEVAAEKREAISDLTPQCQDQMQLFRQTEEVQNRLKEQLQLNADGARQNVHKTVQTLIALVKEEGKRLLTCIESEETARKKQIEAEIEGAQISLASAKSTCEFAETLAREGGDYEVVSFSEDMTTRLNDLTKPPADTVNFELANISVDYSVMEHKLAENSPQTAQYSLLKPTERELYSLLKSAPQTRTTAKIGLVGDNSQTQTSSNNSPPANNDAEATQSRGPKREKKVYNKESLGKNPMPAEQLSPGATIAKVNLPTTKEHKADSADFKTGPNQEDNSLFVDPDVLTYIRHKHHAEIVDIGKKYKAVFETSTDNTKACFVPVLSSVGKDPEPERAIDEFITLYQQVFLKIKCENFDVAQYKLSPTPLFDSIRKVRKLHPEVLTKTSDDDTAVMFMGEPDKIRAARAGLCGLLAIPLSTSARERGDKTRWTAPKNMKSGQPNTGKDKNDEECSICLSVPTNPRSLPCKAQGCKAVFCKKCLDMAMKTTSRCLVCSAVVGKLMGNQPEGKMKVSYNRQIKLGGYKSTGVIVINYIFKDGIQGPEHPNPGKPYNGTTRIAYLPYNSEGEKVLGLLQQAFNQKLTFTIVTSSTTRKSDTVTWNDIHHKTSTYGGTSMHGYPDPGYLKRVTEELAAKGIK